MNQCNNTFSFPSHSFIYTAILDIHSFYFPLVYINKFIKTLKHINLLNKCFKTCIPGNYTIDCLLNTLLNKNIYLYNIYINCIKIRQNYLVQKDVNKRHKDLLSLT